MKKILLFFISILNCHFFVVPLYAGKIILKDGTCIEIPDKLVIYNDLKDSIFVAKEEAAPAPTEAQKRLLALCAANNVVTSLTTGNTILTNTEDEITVNAEKRFTPAQAYVTIEANNNRYKLLYPTYCYAEGILVLTTQTVFAYRASDVINNQCDAQGLTVRFNRQAEIQELKEKIAKLEQLQQLLSRKDE